MFRSLRENLAVIDLSYRDNDKQMFKDVVKVLRFLKRERSDGERGKALVLLSRKRLRQVVKV